MVTTRTAIPTRSPMDILWQMLPRELAWLRPVIFPQGATKVTAVHIYAWDNNTSSSEWFNFHPLQLNSPATKERLGNVSTSD